MDRTSRTTRGGVLDAPLLLRVQSGADQLGVSVSRMWELIAQGEIETVKIGRSRRIPHASLVEYVERLRLEGTRAARQPAGDVA